MPATPSILHLSPTTTPSPINSAPPTISTIISWEASINQTAIFKFLVHLKQGLGDIKESLSEMKKLVKQCFNQVDSMLAEMKVPQHDKPPTALSSVAEGSIIASTRSDVQCGRECR